MSRVELRQPYLSLHKALPMVILMSSKCCSLRAPRAATLPPHRRVG
jgi:hypothetical protein